MTALGQADFLSAEGKGSEFLLSVINKLFPTEDIRPKNLDVVLREENYTTQLSIYPKIELKEGESVEVLLENLTSSDAIRAAYRAFGGGKNTAAQLCLPRRRACTE